ncbi:MAG: acetyl esterase, partial [Porticoccaceae bacterium]
MNDATPSISKYEKLIDKEVWTFINKSNSFFPADAKALSIDDQRASYNEMCNAFKKQPDKAVQ